MSWFIVAMQVGMWFGYVTFGSIGDAFGRKRTYVTYLLMAAVLLGLYVSSRPGRAAPARAVRRVLRDRVLQRVRRRHGRDLSDAIRATAQGFTYNMGRIASAAAPFTVGSLAQTQRLRRALSTASVAFLLAAVMWVWIPETRGRELDLRPSRSVSELGEERREKIPGCGSPISTGACLPLRLDFEPPSARATRE